MRRPIEKGQWILRMMCALAMLMVGRNNVLLLTSEGEFVVKNVVFITAGLVVAAYGLKPISERNAGRKGLFASVMELL